MSEKKPNPALLILAIACIFLATVLIVMTATIETRYYVYQGDHMTAVPLPEWTRYEEAAVSA